MSRNYMLETAYNVGDWVRTKKNARYLLRGQGIEMEDKSIQDVDGRVICTYDQGDLDRCLVKFFPENILTRGKREEWIPSKYLTKITKEDCRNEEIRIVLGSKNPYIVCI